MNKESKKIIDEELKSIELFIKQVEIDGYSNYLESLVTTCSDDTHVAILLIMDEFNNLMSTQEPIELYKLLKNKTPKLKLRQTVFYLIERELVNLEELEKVMLKNI